MVYVTISLQYNCINHKFASYRALLSPEAFQKLFYYLFQIRVMRVVDGPKLTSGIEPI